MQTSYPLVILAAVLVLLQSCSNRPKSYGESIDLSLALFNSQQYQKSVEAAQEALKLEPNSAVAYNNICAANNQLQQWDKAILACQKALIIDPNSALAKNNLAAAQSAGASPADGPIPTKSYEDYINDSLALFNTREYQKSVETAQSALRLQPDSAVAYNNICAAYIQLKQWDQAITAGGKALAIDPNFELAKNNLRAALVASQSATKSYEDYLNDSLVSYNAGEYHKSLEAARSALRLQPDSAIAYNNICAAYYQLKQWDQAVEACQKALAIQPDFERAKNNLQAAQGARTSGTPSSQVTPQQPAAAPDAGDPWTAAISESLTYYQAGDYQKSIEAAQKALAAKPNSAIAYNNICAACNQLKQWDAAIAACQRALAIQPDLELAKNNLRVAQERKPQ
jgi:tetratricopeptide (TPR) repeat protein